MSTQDVRQKIIEFSKIMTLSIIISIFLEILNIILIYSGCKLLKMASYRSLAYLYEENYLEDEMEDRYYKLLHSTIEEADKETDNFALVLSLLRKQRVTHFIAWARCI